MGEIIKNMHFWYNKVNIIYKKYVSYFHLRGSINAIDEVQRRKIVFRVSASLRFWIRTPVYMCERFKVKIISLYILPQNNKSCFVLISQDIHASRDFREESSQSTHLLKMIGYMIKNWILGFIFIYSMKIYHFNS